MVYKIRQKKVLRKMESWKLWGFTDGNEEEPKDMRTIVIRAGEAAVVGPEYSVRLPLREMVTLLKLLDGHFEAIRDGIIMYEDAHRGEQ